MEIVFLVLGVFVFIWAVLMFFNRLNKKNGKGFPYSRDRRKY
jgi:hypothetical protein